MIALYETDNFHFFKTYERVELDCPNCSQAELWFEAAASEYLCTACRHYSSNGMSVFGDSKTDKRVVRQLCQGFTYGASKPAIQSTNNV